MSTACPHVMIACATLASAVPAASLAQDDASGDPVAADAEEAAASPVEYFVDIDFASRYVWRGLAWSQGAVMEPNVEVSSFGVSLWAWANLVLQHEDYEGRFNEVDAGLGYVYSWDWLELSAGLQVWTYPYQEDTPTTGQADVALYVPLGPFAFYTQQTVDIGSYAGAWYGEFGLEFSWETDAGPIVDAALATGFASDKFNDAYVGVAQAAWHHLQTGFAVTFPLSYVYIRAHAQCSYLLDADLRAAVDDPFLVVGGIALGTEGPP